MLGWATLYQKTEANKEELPWLRDAAIGHSTSRSRATVSSFFLGAQDGS
jgi:hypothetical protein